MSTPARVIDSCAFHDWATKDELGPYMTTGWRELLVDRKEIRSALRASPMYVNPQGSKHPEAYPDEGPPGSDLNLVVSQLVDAHDLARVVLGYDDAVLATATTPYVAREVVRAANAWTADRWLSNDLRLFGLILVATELPDEAAKEIRRAGKNERMVGVALGANALGKPFGHSVYRPIYRAAADLELPIVIQVGCDSAASLTTWPLGGGLPATYAEYHALGAHALMSHVASMIVEGVFETFPNLKVMVVGGGATWIPGYVWRLNYWYKLNEHEAPWVKRLPSEYFRDHVRVSTYTLEDVHQDRIWRALDTVPWIGSCLMYASGYPNVDWESATALLERLPEPWRQSVIYDNADEFFRWPSSVRKRRDSVDTREPVASSAMAQSQED